MAALSEAPVSTGTLIQEFFVQCYCKVLTKGNNRSTETAVKIVLCACPRITCGVEHR